MSLKDFKTDEPDFENHDPKETAPIESHGYQEEIASLKIDKLSNRVTIISIILPCIIGAILVFAYLDMKERVVDVDQTKNTQVERISQQLDGKLNALDVKIAKNRFDLDKQIPTIESKQVALEGNMARLATTKADDKAVKAVILKLEKQVADVRKQEKASQKKLGVFKKRLDENTTQIDKTLGKIKDDITLFKEEFDARLLELSDYELQIGDLRKNFSLTDKKVRRVEEEAVSKTILNEKTEALKTIVATELTQLEDQIARLEKKLAANVSRLQKDVDLALKQSSEKSGPQPHINIEMKDPETKPIDEKSLTE